MSWIKDAALDLFVLLLFILYSLFPHAVFEVLLWVYTSLLLISKIMSVFMLNLQKRAQATEVPDLVYHFIYALTSGLLIYIKDYYLAGCWVIIWVLSVVIKYNSSKK